MITRLVKVSPQFFSGMMSPLIQETIKSSVASAIKSLKTTILQPILEASKTLQDRVNKQDILIQKHQEKTRNSLHFNNLTVDTSQKGEDMIHGVVHFWCQAEKNQWSRCWTVSSIWKKSKR